ncbi:hypothetical protein D5086_011465 [Populus alba]|uniref:Uncharacterized protein n=1 Tax=Populus alba TaxID=43335 RepID=A0ACC4CDF3_POPAL
MESSLFYHDQHLNSDFSPECSFGSFDSFSWDELLFQSNSLPFNTNDSEEMVLFNALANGAPKESSESNSSSGIKEEEVTSNAKEEEEAKREKSYRGVRRRPWGKPQNVVVLEDLGADYLEELLNSCDSSNSW